MALAGSKLQKGLSVHATDIAVYVKYHYYHDDDDDDDYYFLPSVGMFPREFKN